jgi:ribose transport system ATP-binding protein
VSGAPELAVEAVTKRFPGTTALDDVSLDVRAGEIHAVIGENGAGKTTLLMILSGVYAPDEGRILRRGEEIAFSRPQDAQAQGIGTVFQELSLVAGLSVAENVFAGRQPTNRLGTIDRRRMQRETRDLLVSLGSPIRPDERVASLDVGERQIVEIVKALSLEVRLLLLDEPTSALSSEETAHLFDVLRRLAERGIGVVFVSHRLSEVFEIANRVTVLRDGRLVGTYEREELTLDKAVRLMVGRELSILYPDRADVVGKPLLEVLGLVSGPVGPIDLTVREGEVVGIAGLRGAGRSRLVRAVAGVERRERGNIHVNGRPVRIRRPWHALERRIAVVPSDRKNEGLFLRMPLGRNLVAAALRLVSRLGFVSGPAEERLADRLMRELDIRARGIDQPVQTLSGGNQQKAMLAKWLALEPRILLVDEPTQGVDVGAKAEIHELLRRLARQGVAVLMVSSELPELLGMCDRIVVMANGLVAGELDGRHATEEEVMTLAAGAEGRAA